MVSYFLVFVLAIRGKGSGICSCGLGLVVFGRNRDMLCLFLGVRLLLICRFVVFSFDGMGLVLLRVAVIHLE